MTDEQVERVVAEWFAAPIGPDGHLTRMLALSILAKETVERGQRQSDVRCMIQLVPQDAAPKPESL